MYRVDFTDNSVGYTSSYLTKEYEGDDYVVIYVNTESLKKACIDGGTNWPQPFNEWSRRETLGIESKPDFFIRSYNPENNYKGTITWMPSVLWAEIVSIKRTFFEYVLGKNPKTQLRIIFKNGRHRAEFFRYLGAEYIPVLTKRDKVEILSLIGNGIVEN